MGDFDFSGGFNFRDSGDMQKYVDAAKQMLRAEILNAQIRALGGHQDEWSADLQRQVNELTLKGLQDRQSDILKLATMLRDIDATVTSLAQSLNN